MRVDAKGAPHVVYASTWRYHLDPTEIRIADRVGASWTTSVIGAGHSPGLAFAPNGDLHVAFTKTATTAPTERLVHATRTTKGSAFTIEPVADTEFTFAAHIASSIAVDAAGGVHIPFIDSSYVDSTVYYAYKSGAAPFAKTMLRGPHPDEKLDDPRVQLDKAGVADVFFTSHHELVQIRATYPF
jgi:hypothetical protein